MTKALSLTAVLLSFAAPQALAQNVITPDSFEALVAGKTLYFSQRGSPYGAEQYLRNRKVIWTFLGERCQFGEWYGDGDNICFIYDNQPGVTCWSFFDGPQGKTARVIGADPVDDLLVTGQDQEPLDCPAPELGVSYPAPDDPSPGDGFSR